MATGKLAVVTGADRGLGRVMALALAERGWNIAFTYIGADTYARTLEDEIDALGG